MNIQGILSMLGLDNGPFLAAIAEAGAATDKFTQGVAESASTAGDELQALSDRLKEALAVGGKFQPEDYTAAVNAGLIGADNEFHEYVADVKNGMGEIGTAVENGNEKIAASSEKAAADFAGNFIKGIEVLKNAFATFITALPFIGIMKESTKAIVGFDAALVDMQAHTLVAANVIQQLGEYASFATDSLSQFHELDAVAGLELLARAGQDVVTSMGNLPAVLNLAAVAGMNVAQAADIVTTTMSQFNMSMMDATRVADVYTKASQMSKVSTEELSSMMRYMAATMDGAGYSFEASTAYVTAFAQAGLIARQASTALATAVESLANMSTEGQEVLDRYGVALTDSAGKVRPLIDVVVELKKAGASTTDMLSVFGASSQKITTVLANLGSEGFDKLLKGLEDSKGSAKDAAGILQTSLASSLDTVHKSLADIWLSLGKDMKPALQIFMAGINGLLDLIKKAVQGIEGWSTSMKVLVGVFMSLALAIIPAASLIKTLIGTLGVLKLTLAGLTIAGGPFFQVALAIAAVTAVILAGIVAWNDYKDAATRAATAGNAEAQMARFDQETAVGGGYFPSDEYYKDRAAKRIALEKEIYEKTSAANGRARDIQAANDQKYIDDQKDIAAAAANAKVKIAKDLFNATYTLTHSAYQNEMLVINDNVAAYAKAGNDKVAVAKYRAAAIADLNKRTAEETSKLQDAAMKKDDAVLQKAQDVADAIVQANFAAQDALASITMDETQYALKQLKDMMAEWKESGVKEVTIAAYSAERKKEIWGDYSRAVTAINEKEAADAKKIADDMQDITDAIVSANFEASNELASNVLEEKDYALRMLKQKMDGWRASGVERIVIEKYTSSETKRIWDDYYKGETEAMEKFADDMEKRAADLVDAINSILEDNATQYAQKAEDLEQYNADVAEALEQHLADIATFNNALEDFLLSSYQRDSKTRQDILDNTHRNELSNIQSTTDALNERYGLEIDKINEVARLKLGPLDIEMKALDAGRQKTQDVKTLAQLQENIVRAETRAALKQAEEALRAFNADQIYNAQKTRIQTEIDAITEQAKLDVKGKEASQAIELQNIKDTTAAIELRYTTETEANRVWLATKMSDESVSAAVTLLLQQNTHAQIVALMKAQLEDYRAAGLEAGSAFFSAYNSMVSSAVGALAPAQVATPAEVAQQPVYNPATSTYMSPVQNQAWEVAIQNMNSQMAANLQGPGIPLGPVQLWSPPGVPSQTFTPPGASSTGSGATETLLRSQSVKLDTLISAVRGVASGVGGVINGIAMRR